MDYWLVVRHRTSSGGPAGTQAVISAHPPPLVSESCQMIREPAQQLFGRDKQQHKAAQWVLMGFWLSTKRENVISLSQIQMFQSSALYQCPPWIQMMPIYIYLAIHKAKFMFAEIWKLFHISSNRMLQLSGGYRKWDFPVTTSPVVVLLSFVGSGWADVTSIRCLAGCLLRSWSSRPVRASPSSGPAKASHTLSITGVD